MTQPLIGVVGENGQVVQLSTFVVSSLAQLGQVSASVPSGSVAQVLDQGSSYSLDRANTFAPDGFWIVGATGGGNWFRVSKRHVVANTFLWATDDSFSTQKIYGYGPGQQSVTATLAAPDVLLDVSATLNPLGLGVADALPDLFGNLWIAAGVKSFLAGASPGAIGKVAAVDTLQSGAPTAAAAIAEQVNAAETFTACIGFDKSNALWSLSSGHGTFGLANFSKYGQPIQVRNSIVPVNPDLFLTTTAATRVTDSEYFVFDAQGNLWGATPLGGAGNTGLVYQVSAAQLAASNAALVPAVQWNGSNFAGTAEGLAFGSDGLLYVAYFGSNNIRAYDTRAAASGNPAPVKTFTCATFNGPECIAFDRSGNLWVANFSNNKLMRIPVAQLAASGVLVPDVILTCTGVPSFLTITFPQNVQRSGLVGSGYPGSP